MRKSPSASIAAVGNRWSLVVNVFTRNSVPTGWARALNRWA
jgi:hypothetical protein